MRGVFLFNWVLIMEKSRHPLYIWCLFADGSGLQASLIWVILLLLSIHFSWSYIQYEKDKTCLVENDRNMIIKTHISVFPFWVDTIIYRIISSYRRQSIWILGFNSRHPKKICTAFANKINTHTLIWDRSRFW